MDKIVWGWIKLCGDGAPLTFSSNRSLQIPALNDFEIQNKLFSTIIKGFDQFFDDPTEDLLPMTDF